MPRGQGLVCGLYFALVFFFSCLFFVFVFIFKETLYSFTDFLGHSQTLTEHLFCVLRSILSSRDADAKKTVYRSLLSGSPQSWWEINPEQGNQAGQTVMSVLEGINED